jgi:hypothetical protein
VKLKAYIERLRSRKPNERFTSSEPVVEDTKRLEATSTQLDNILRHFFVADRVDYSSIEYSAEIRRHYCALVGDNTSAAGVHGATELRGLRFLDMSPADSSIQDLLQQYGAKVDRPPLDIASLRALAGQYDGLFCHGGINSTNFCGQEFAHQQYLETVVATTRADGLLWISPHNSPRDDEATRFQKSFFKTRGFIVHEINQHQSFALNLTRDFGVSTCYPSLIYTKNLSPRWIHEDYNSETYFPRTLLKEMAEILWAKNGDFAVYRDFPVHLDSPNQDEAKYEEEWVRFNALARGQPPVVFLQHDADHTPYKTVDLMEYEHSLGIRSSSYFFYEQNLSNRYEPYTLDIERLKSLESNGFEIGYHLNAYELAGYDIDKAFELVERDLDFLEQHFRITSFVPHGGVPGPFGINNQMIPHARRLRNYQWPYHHRGLKCNYYWSDGSIASEVVHDPRVMMRKLDRGERMMFLMHPQYYGDELSPHHENLPLAKERWWRKLWDL